MKRIMLLSLLPLLLTSCIGGSSSFFDKTFTYKNDVYFNLEYETEFNKTYRQVIEEQMKNDNISWDASGAYGGFSVVNFDKHSNYNEMIDSMKSMAKNAFDETYKGGLTIEVGSLANKDCTITLGNEKKSYKLKTYADNPEDALYQQIVDGENVVGSLNVPSIKGSSVKNGQFSCIELTYKGITSRTKFLITFKKEVQLGSQSYDSMEWHVWAKINN